VAYGSGHLWVAGTAGYADTGLQVAPGSSPSVAGLAGGGYEVAFLAQGPGLWTCGSRGTRGLALPLKDGTSPSIAGLVGRG